MSSLFIYTRAVDIPEWVTRALERHNCNANVILPQIEKSMRNPPSRPQLWIVYAPSQRVEYILAVTEGVVAAYPLFIFTTEPIATLAGLLFEVKMDEIAGALHENVDVRRIYSVFAPRPICFAFCNAWTRLTGIPIETKPNPYYDAFISYCTPQTLRSSNRRPGNGHEHKMRHATTRDIPMVSAMCQGFSEESEPFVLDRKGAEKEARYLIDHNLVWVYMARESSEDEYEVACVVACTRNMKRVWTITKVYTPKEWRGKGCAEHLVRHVCMELFDQGKKSVTLYVGVSNPASRVYDKVGFVGLDDSGIPVSGVDRWLEIGFNRNKVDLGHW
ncbi:hypothetical protein AX15_004286 [Amanita polypyramis BW_CC]|nr:hypothetical protein AX15_004286 [Amanita polypyramis BW_CC]